MQIKDEKINKIIRLFLHVTFSVSGIWKYRAVASLLTIKDLSSSVIVLNFQEKLILEILIEIIRAEMVEKVAYDLVCATRLIISFGTVIKNIFARYDQLIGLGTAEYLRAYTHTPLGA